MDVTDVPNSVVLPKSTMDDSLADGYVQTLSLAILALADLATMYEKDEERLEKKQRVVTKKREGFESAFEQDIPAGTQLVRLLQHDLPHNQAMRLLIDLAFADPYAPYELETKAGDFEASLISIAHSLGLSGRDARDVLETKKKAFQAHHRIDWRRVAIVGVAATITLGSAGYLAAPALAAALGSASGLSGAAAVAHGLAMLGGGSLAMGGGGMAGGLWLVTSAGAAGGAIAGGGGMLLFQLGSAAAVVELTKAQVSFKHIVMADQVERRKAQEYIGNLAAQKAALEQKLAEEQVLNDKKAVRIHELEKTIKAVEESIEWMQSQANEAA